MNVFFRRVNLSKLEVILKNQIIFKYVIILTLKKIEQEFYFINKSIKWKIY
jgi:hypothetical protein